MAAIRPKAYEALEPESDRTGEVEVLEIEIPDDVIKVQTVETVTEEAEGIQTVKNAVDYINSNS